MISGRSWFLRNIGRKSSKNYSQNNTHKENNNVMISNNFSSNFINKTKTNVIAFCLLSSFYASSSLANMGNIASTYGASARDIASAQGLSMFNSSAAGVYYNSAYLTQTKESGGGEINAGLLLSGGELRAVGNARSGSVISDAEKGALVVGIKTDLSKLTTFEKPIYLGVLVAIEDYGTTLLDFNSSTSETGQFLEYDNQPIFITIGGGIEIIDGFSTGLSGIVTLDADASMSAIFEDLAGTTKNESINITGEPQVSFIFSGLLELEKLLCSPETSNCFASGIELSGSYRESSQTDTKVDANVLIEGLGANEIAFTINTLDAYQPASITLGMLFNVGPSRVALSVEQQNWSNLTGKFANDSVRDQANIEFVDIVIPRIAAEFNIADDTQFITGLALRKSPLESTESPDINIFDNDRIIAGFGLSTQFELSKIIKNPLRLDLGYQYQKLDDRQFRIRNNSSSSSNNNEIVKTDGDLHIVSGSITLKF